MSAGITRFAAAFVPLSNQLWNDSETFRIGSRPTELGNHRGEIALVMVTRNSTVEESVYQRMTTAPVRHHLTEPYSQPAIAVFDGDSVTAGAGSPGAAYGTWSWPAQLFGNVTGQSAGGQWTGKFSPRNIAVGGRAIASSEAAWNHTTQHILRRSEWGRKYYFGMISHNEPSMGSDEKIQRVVNLWRQAKRLNAQPICIGLLFGQKAVSDAANLSYEKMRQAAESNQVPFVDCAAISQLRDFSFPSGSSYFYNDVIHPTDKGYRLIAQEVAATVPFPGSSVPRSLSRPKISGNEIVGSTLSCDLGSWENQPSSFQYQWMRNATDIDGANQPNYLLQAEDVGAKLSCRVTAVSSFGNAERTSSHTAVVTAISK